MPGRFKVYTPIIFRAIKVEKSSPQENIIFRTENIEKSHLGRMVEIEKFSEIFFGGMFGEKELPPTLLRLRARFKYERYDDIREQR